MKDEINYASTDPELNKRIAMASDAIKREAKKDGAFFARKNRPTLAEPSLRAYISRYHTQFNELLRKEIGSIKPEMQEAALERFKTEHIRQLTEINDKIETLDHQNQLDRRALDGKAKPEQKKRNPFALFLLGVLYTGESFYNSLAFAFLGGNLIGATLIGITITIIEGVLAYTIGKNLARIDDGEKPAPIQLAISTIASIGIVIAMSILRANMDVADDAPHLPVWVLVCINISFLIGSIYLSKLIVPSKKVTAADDETRTRYEAIEKREAEMEALNKQKKTMQITLTDEEDKVLVVHAQVKWIAEYLDSQFKDTIELFKTENLITRSDLGTPICFFEHTPSLQS